MNKKEYYIINGITLYRLVMAPVLMLLIFTHQVPLFKWLLAISYLTDLIDGWLARKFKATSIMGARLDSVADDLTIVAGIIAVFMQGAFLILLFFLPRPLEFVFFLAFAVTVIDLVEEIILVILLPEWEPNVKGLYWVIKRKRGDAC